jgi:predicted transglutaminase-like cysteine proteinase
MVNIIYSWAKYGNWKEKRVTTCPVHIRNGAYQFNQFIRPQDVTHIASQLKPHASTRQEAISQAFNFVTSNIMYKRDHHIDSRVDFWQFPYETLRKGTGDCEDMAFLLASILMQMGLYHVRVALGKLNNRGHAWVEAYDGYQWHILDSTSKRMYPLSDREKQGYEVDYTIYHGGCIRHSKTESTIDFFMIFLLMMLLFCFGIIAVIILIFY